MFYLSILALFSFIFTLPLNAGTYKLSTQKPWIQNREAIEKALATSKFITRTPMSEFLKAKGKKSDFTNEVFLVELENGMKAVFKYDYEERDMYGEVAAYKASMLTGIDCVPPTVIRSAYKMRGSLQLYVETTTDGASSETAFTKAYERVPALERADAEAFAFVFGQWDKSFGNFLFTSSPDSNTLGLVLIDNSGTSQLQYVRIGEAPFIRRMYSDKRKDKWSSQFPFDKICEIPYETITTHKDIKDFDLGPTPFPFLKAEQKSLRYILWNNSLWFQAHISRPFIPTQISRAFFNKLVSLNEKNIKEIWKESPKSWPIKQKQEIIKLTLERRNQLVSYIKMNNIEIK